MMNAESGMRNFHLYEFIWNISNNDATDASCLTDCTKFLKKFLIAGPGKPR